MLSLSLATWTQLVLRSPTLLNPVRKCVCLTFSHGAQNVWFYLMKIAVVGDCLVSLKYRSAAELLGGG